MNSSRKWISLFLVLACAFTFAYAVDPEESYEGKTIEKIDLFLKNQTPSASFEPSRILSRLKSQKGALFSQQTFDQDLKMLSDEFDQVLPHFSLNHEKLDISIDLFAKSLIRSINWKGNVQISSKSLQKELGIKPSTIFSKTEFHKALNKIKEFYIKKGYFESEVSYTTLPIPKKNEIDLVIQIKEGKLGRVKTILFDGFSSEEESELLSMIYTKKYNFLISWLTGQGIFREDAMEQDQMTVLNYLQNKGYADATVQIQILEDKPSNKIILKIVTKKGKIYHFGNISFSGNVLFSQDEISKAFLIHTGDLYSPEKLRDSAQAVKNLYGQKGYIESEVFFETNLSETQPIYDVNFRIEEGNCFKIGMIHIQGNTHTKSNVILRESLLIPGETFDQRKLKATQEKLEHIGYFKHVNVYAVRTSEDSGLGENYRDVHIEVEETTTGQVSLSVGFSSLDNVYGSIDLTERNFNAHGISELSKEGPSAFRGGGEFIHLQTTVGAKQNNYSLSWMDPYFRDSSWRVGFETSLTNNRLQSNDYRIKTYGFSLFASYPLTAYWDITPKYRLRRSCVHMSKKIDAEERERADRSSLISAVGVATTYDNTDNSYKPHKGIRSTIETEFAGVGGTARFFKLGWINSLYQGLWSKGTIKYRADFRFIEPVGSTKPETVPLSERFFLGGENSVRGYKPFILGPRFSRRKDPKGGISSGLLSVEYNQTIIKVMDAFVFFDAGSVSLERAHIRKFNASYGLGVRLALLSNTPFVFGIGFPINPDYHQDVQRFFFSMGGQF